MEKKLRITPASGGIVQNFLLWIIQVKNSIIFFLYSIFVAVAAIILLFVFLFFLITGKETGEIYPEEDY